MDLKKPGDGCQSLQEGLWVSLVRQQVLSRLNMLLRASVGSSAFPGLGGWGVMEESSPHWSRMERKDALVKLI